MRHPIAELGQIDFVGVQELPLRVFHYPHHGHEIVALLHRQLRHFGDMILPDDPRKARVVRVVNINDPYGPVLPKNRAARGQA